MNFVYKQKVIFLFLILSLTTILFSAQIVQASGVDQIMDGLNVSAGKAGIDTSPESNDLPTRLGKTINYGFGILGSIIMCVILLGGVRWMTAGGNEEKLKKGKGIISGALDGLIAIFLAYALVWVFLFALKEATG